MRNPTGGPWPTFGNLFTRLLAHKTTDQTYKAS
jgi:hypothetical protein